MSQMGYFNEEAVYEVVGRVEERGTYSLLQLITTQGLREKVRGDSENLRCTVEEDHLMGLLRDLGQGMQPAVTTQHGTLGHKYSDITLLPRPLFYWLMTHADQLSEAENRHSE